MRRVAGCALALLFAVMPGGRPRDAWAQGDGRAKAARDERRGVRSVTIPVTLRLRDERERRQSEELQTLNLTVLEDNEPQQILSVRSAPAANAPLSFAVLVQDDLVSSIGNEINPLAEFIRRMSSGSRVMVGYLRAGSLQVRQRFTGDLERAAKSLRIPAGSSSAGPYNPYVQVIEALKRFDSQPVGRRAVLVVSDGLDLSRGLESSYPSQSVDLQRAISEAQRRGVAVYTIYAPTVSAPGGLFLVSNGQGSLQRLADETGGKAYFQGRGAPVSFDPFLRDLGDQLSRQFALTYLSTHQDKGFHRIKIEAAAPDVDIRHPAGYTR